MVNFGRSSKNVKGKPAQIEKNFEEVEIKMLAKL